VLCTPPVCTVLVIIVVLLPSVRTLVNAVLAVMSASGTNAKRLELSAAEGS